jgi:hypothetical protein
VRRILEIFIGVSEGSSASIFSVQVHIYSYIERMSILHDSNMPTYTKMMLIVVLQISNPVCSGICSTPTEQNGNFLEESRVSLRR